MARLSWLISALLVLSSAGFGANQRARYVGSNVCFGCHADIYRSFLKTDMGRSMRSANDLSPASIPDEARVQIAGGTRSLKVSHDATGWYQSEEEPNVFLDRHKLDYVVGSGANGLSFIVRRGNNLVQAPLSFYSKAANWELSPGYQYADYGFSRPIDAECMLCHSGRPQPVEGHRGEYLNPPFQELAIACENCHGPGEFHVKQGRTPNSIINPAKLPPRLAENICMNCHQGADARVLQPDKHYVDFRPGQWLIATVALFKIPSKAGEQKESDLLEHNYAMRISRCFRESRGKLSCLTCHDPHVQPAPTEAVSYFRTKCFLCHTDESCKLPKTARMARTPADDCTGCHMPKRNVAVISHSALTNHRIPARLDEPMPQQQQPDATGLVLVNPASDNSVPVAEVTLLRAYAEIADRDSRYQQHYLELLGRLAESQPPNAFVQAALGHKALAEGKNEEALTHLSKGLALHDVTVYQDMAKALTNLGRGEEAVEYLKSASDMEPFNAVLLKTLVLEYINLKRYAEARQSMERYVELFPEDSFMRQLLARVSN